MVNWPMLMLKNENSNIYINYYKGMRIPVYNSF